jgi:hypothetical protein
MRRMKSASPVESAEVAVVGGGPAGMMAAIAAAERGRRVILLEQLPRLGRKLLATGGGRCNLTNTLPPAEFMARFGRQGRFMQPALAALDWRGLRGVLGGLGVPTHAPDGLHVYPVSNSAATVERALEGRASQLGVALHVGVLVTGLWIEAGRLAGLRTEGGPIAAPRVILATGGRSYPALGATGAGYELARQAGHTIVRPTPALVPLVTRQQWPRQCAGVSLSSARVWIDLPRQSRGGVTGDVLFTHAGLSGPAVLDLSGDVAALLVRHEEVPVRLDVAPGTSAAQWSSRFDRWQAAGGAKTVRGLLGRCLPKSLAAAVCAAAGIDPASRPAAVPRAARGRLAQHLTAMPLTVVGTEGWDRAMATRGGVSLKEVCPRTLESRRLARLFFAGEILDLDGPSGGFNLQWAFSSGRLAGQSSAECSE